MESTTESHVEFVPSRQTLQNIIDKFMEEYSVAFPNYLVRLLKFCGWDNVVSLSSFKQEHFTQMEDFAKNILPDLLDEHDKEEFYGIFSRKTSHFKIMDGHRELLLKLVSMVSKQNDKRQLKRKCVCDNKNQSRYEPPKKNTRSSTSHEKLSESSTEESSTQQSLNLKTKDHVLTLARNYIKTLCTKELNDDHKEILNKLDKLDVVVKDEWAQIKCILCGNLIKVFLVNSKYGKKWVLSNFNNHFKGHIGKKVRKRATSATIANNSDTSTNQQQTDLMSFLIVPPMQQVDEEQGISQTFSQTNPLDNSSVFQTVSSSVPIINSTQSSRQSNDQNFSTCGIMKQAHNAATITLPQIETKTTSKWKNEKYSRHQRNLRSLEVYDIKQPKITDFIEVVDRLKKLYNESEEIQCSFNNTALNNKTLEPRNVFNFLDILKETTLRNLGKKKHGKRFSDPLKLFCLYMYIIGGRLAYETLYKNLSNAIPSLTTIHRTLDEGERVMEGHVRMAELKEYLLKRNLPLSVFISEDQTTIVQTVQYEPKLNKMVGFVLPLCNNTGFPELDKFTVHSVNDIERAFRESNLSKTAYFFMAQPLQDNVPAFCLCVFGSDNRFTADDVSKRWKYLIELAKSYSIEVVGFSSDGDSRCLKSMKIESKLPYSLDISSCPYKPYFQMDFSPEKPVFIQDTVHIGTKLKTRLLKPNIVLPMGKYHVSVSHIETLIDTFSKDRHLLCKSLLESSDKMNFEAINKMSSRKVIELMQEIPGSDATRQYLLLTRNILDSFLDKHINLLQRLYLAWYSIFFIRAWRQWILKNNFSVTKNFITSNIYTCIELNGHSLLLLIEKCRKTENEKIILPWLCSSQPCEKSFRQTRSMTSTFSTIVNFSMSDVMSRLRRIQALNEISCDLGDRFYFPREQDGRLGQPATKLTDNELPSQEEIVSIINKALYDAQETTISLGMSNIDVECFKVADIRALETKIEKRAHKDAFNVSSNEKDVNLASSLTINEHAEIKNLFSNFDDLNLTDYSNTNIRNTTPFLKVTLKNKQLTVRKSSLCWFFAKKSGRLSVDRLMRVRGPKTNNEKCFKLAPKNTKEGKNDSIETISETEWTDESEEENYSVRNTSDSDGSINKDSDGQDEGSDEVSKIVLTIEQYYAIYYDDKWELGRIINIKEGRCRVKFLKEDLDSYIWPKKDLIFEVEKHFLFYGPLHLEGTHPFKLKRLEKNAIQKKYRAMKGATE